MSKVENTNERTIFYWAFGTPGAAMAGKTYAAVGDPGFINLAWGAGIDSHLRQLYPDQRQTLVPVAGQLRLYSQLVW